MSEISIDDSLKLPNVTFLLSENYYIVNQIVLIIGRRM